MSKCIGIIASWLVFEMVLWIDTGCSIRVISTSLQSFIGTTMFPLRVLSSIIPLFSSEEEILLPSQLLWILNCYSRLELFGSFLLPQLWESENNTRDEECADTMTDLWSFHLAICTIWSLILILTLLTVISKKLQWDVAFLYCDTTGQYTNLIQLCLNNTH